MSEQDMNQADVTAGQIYVGWGKRWLVTKVYPNGVVEGHMVGQERVTFRLPLTQFCEDARQSEDNDDA